MKMFKVLAVMMSVYCFAVSTQASAKSVLFDGKINSAKINIKTDANGEKKAVAVLNVSYSGGCKVHKFALNYGPCQEIYPMRCFAKLMLTEGNDDNCEAYVTQKIRFELNSDLGDNYFITISGKNSTTGALHVELN